MNELEFKNPPVEFGEVSFFWWHGDRIEKKKLLWILEQLKEMHICGLQINYCHSDQGGQQFGLTMDSEPVVFSDEWWELTGWFTEQCSRQNIAVSLSDYTLGAPGQNSYMDRVLKKHPEYQGQQLIYDNGKVLVEKVPFSANPIHPGIGKSIVEEFYGAFEAHFPGRCGKGINYFFSDELNFNIRGNLWSDHFAKEFKLRKGYDIVPKLKGIFEDIGDETPKIRMDYYDVIVELSEESYFKPVFEWHEERGMIFGCDHGGRGKDITEFGDYFRTMRWYQGPGNDQPRLESDLIKSKVSASIAHLYERPRVWLEGFYSSGWQTSASDVADAVFRNFALGHNLLSLHGLYYSMCGSMWEWAPPCNHFHMPYWEEMKELLGCTKRLSYILAQGKHRCDAAVIYPVAAMEADIAQGEIAVETAFRAAKCLYTNGFDFDFIDFQSIEKSEIVDRNLCVAGEVYQAVIIPSMGTVRFKMLSKLEQFVLQGGLVICIGDIPKASDRIGRNDHILKQKVQTITQKGYHVRDSEEMLSVVKKKIARDFWTEAENVYFIHRIIDGKDFYMVYGVPKGKRCVFRAVGSPVILNPWNGEWRKIHSYRLKDGRTEIAMPLESTLPFLILFEREENIRHLETWKQQFVQEIKIEGVWDCEIHPTMDNTYGDYRLPAFNGYIGAEARGFSYKVTEENCSDPDYDDCSWSQSLYSYGPYFWECKGHEESQERFIAMDQPEKEFNPYLFSMKMGIEGDAGYQGSYHGLKGMVSDDFLAMGKKEITQAGASSIYTGEEITYFFTCIDIDEDQWVLMKTGALRPSEVWIDHIKLEDNRLFLKKGRHTLLLKFMVCGRTHVVFERIKGFVQKIPLSMCWYQNPNIVPFNAHPEYEGRYCWYRLTAPPGMESLKLVCKGEADIWADGVLMEREGERFFVKKPKMGLTKIAVRIRQVKNYYQTAAILQPIEFYCSKGEIDIRQPFENIGLKFYSGGVCYRKLIKLLKMEGRTGVQFGNVEGTIRLKVNGREAAVIICEPYFCDITDYIIDGENEFEIMVHNTLSNHMLSIPTNFNTQVSAGFQKQ